MSSTISAGPTLVHRLLAQAEELESTAALRWRDDDRWHEHSWEQYCDLVLDFAAGLIGLGLEPGQTVGLLSHNQPRWVLSDLGVLAAGGVSVPAYPNSIPSQVSYLLLHSDATLCIAANAEQLRKIKQVRDELPALRKVILLDDDEHCVDGEFVIGFQDVIDAGRRAGQGEAMARVEALDPEAMATIVYTSGTTGPPKGAMLSHRNLVFMADAILQVLVVDDTHSSLSFLPLSHVAERLQGEVVAVTAGITVNYAEDLTTITRDLGEVNATLLLCVPRLWEKIYATIQSGVADAPPLRQRLFDWAVAAGEERFEVENHGRTPNPVLLARYAIADRLVFSKLRARLGMTYVEALASGAAPLSRAVGTFFAGLGLKIQEVYGQTECTGVCTANPQGRLKFGTVGPPLPGVDVKIAEDGEILVRGPNVFLGYFKQPQATAETVVDGWLLTGDIGEFDDEGYLRITDRKKDIIVTAGGKNVAPQNIENLLKPQRGVSQVVVVGDKRKFLSALITLDLEEMAAVLETDLPEMEACVDHKGVIGVLQGYVDEVNRGLASYETIKKFQILPKDFSVEDGELTPTLKVKRRVIQKTYVDLIDGFYSEKFD